MLDSQSTAGPDVPPADVTSAAKQGAVAEGSGKPLNAVPAPLYAGGSPPSMMTSPAPPATTPPSSADTASYIHVSPCKHL